MFDMIEPQVLFTDSIFTSSKIIAGIMVMNLFNFLVIFRSSLSILRNDFPNYATFYNIQSTWVVPM
jgi:hypothetical protein